MNDEACSLQLAATYSLSQLASNVIGDDGPAKMIVVMRACAGNVSIPGVSLARLIIGVDTE